MKTVSAIQHLSLSLSPTHHHHTTTSEKNIPPNSRPPPALLISFFCELPNHPQLLPFPFLPFSLLCRSLALSLPHSFLALTHSPPTTHSPTSLPLSNSQSRAHEAKDKCLKTSKSNPSSVLEKCSVYVYIIRHIERRSTTFSARFPPTPKIPSKTKTEKF